MTEGQYPIDTTRLAPLDTHIDLSLLQLDLLRIVLLGIIPACNLGGWILLSRRRR